VAQGGQLVVGSTVVTRWRHAAVRSDVLTQADGSPRVGVGGRIGLNLFDDASFTLTITNLHRQGPTGYTWSGTLDGIDFGSAILAVHDGAIVGTVIMPGAVYRIGYAADGTQVIEQVDTSALPPGAEPVITIPLVFGDSRASYVVAADGASQIDVMIVYTAAARFAAGGTAAMQAEVNVAVASANQAYANNGLVQRLRLVFAGEVAITETNNFSGDLDSLRQNTTVGSLRNTYGADLVSLFTHNGPAPAFCGIGYLMSVNSTSFAPYAFSVVERQCAGAALSFAHELGHNMGGHHDPYVTSDPGLAAYSHGYVDLTARFFTIMAYPNQCQASGFNCTRIAFFSSPNQTVNGRVIGTASTSDNVRTLGETANTVANFRQAVVTSPPVQTVPKVFRDLNGDGKADVLWRHDSGTVAMWLLNGTSVIGSGAPATVSTQWTIVGVGDFNGDGKADILWQHVSGSVAVWLLDGTTVIGSGSPGVVPAGWTVAGVGDFDGDGKADVLWRHSSGAVVVWLVNGTGITSIGVVGSVPSDWTIVGVGDVNGDGKADILFRTSAGTVVVWLVNGTSLVGSGSPGGAGSDWNIAGVGDFNGDGRADILWRHSSGTLVVWLLNGFSIVGSGSPGSASTDWTVVGVGDFNGDGRADILWRHSSGTLAVWLLNGFSVVGSGSPGGASIDWQIQ
jgi:hypothetical protein